jgi:hypothetical protein
VPALLIRHRVKDFATWKAVFDEYAMTRRANGSQGGQVFRSADDPNEVVILLAWDDIERARLFADSDDLRGAMLRAEVAERPDVWFLEEAEQPAV